jgi:PAS domain S-box-containing protein
MQTSFEDTLRRSAGWAAIGAALVGSAALADSTAQTHLLASLRHGSMPDGTTAAVILLGSAALWLLHGGKFARAGAGCAAAMLVVALVGVARPFFRSAGGFTFDSQFGAALAFAPLAVALLLLRPQKKRGGGLVRLWLAGVVISVSAASLFTLAFPSASDGGQANYPGLPASLAALLLGLGVILARPDDAFIRLFFARTASGLLVRRLFFGAVLVPAVLSRLFILLVLNDVVRFNDGVLLLASVMIFSGFVITMLSAGKAVSQDQWREEADRERLQLTSRLEQQAAQLQEMVSQRTRELHEANVGLSAAAESNAGLALVANHTTNGVVIADPLGRVEWCNTAFERLTGFSLLDIKGKKVGLFLQGPQTDPATVDQLRQAIHRGEPCKVEVLNYTKDRRPFWQAVDLEPVRDRTGRVVKYISIQTDITDQRQAKQNLQTLNHRLELATRAADLGVWEWDESRGIFIWDRRMLEIHGVSPADFHGTFEEWARDVHPDDRPRIVELFQAVRTGANELEHTFRLILPRSGAVCYLEARGIADRDPQGRLLRITGTCRDITAEREATVRTAALNERLQLALSSSNYGVWELDFITNRMSWDDRMFQIYAIRREEFDGSRTLWEKRLHPDDRQEATDFARRIIAGELARYDDTFRILRDDGEVRHIEAHGYVQRDPKGNPLRLVGLNRDITAETRTIEALRIAEERWQLAIEGTNDAAWDWDVATGAVFHDERWARMLGYSPQEMDPSLQGWRQLMHPEDLPVYAEAIDSHFHRRAPFYSQELRVRAKDGQWRWVLDRGKVVSRDSEGRPLRMAGTHTDITDRKQLEQRLQRMEDLASQVSQLAQIGGWELEGETGQVTWSRVINTLFELPEDFAPSLPAMMQLFAPEAQITLQAALQASRASGSSFDLELPANSSTGRRVWVRVLGKPHVLNRRALSIQGAMQDITARRESEETRHQLELQLFQAQKMETLGTFAGGIAHDFNNLLTGILGYHELAADSLPADHPAHTCLLEARNASLRARELVEQILTFGRQSSGVEHGPVDLALVIDEARRFLRAAIPASIDISAEVPEDRFHVLADPTQIHQVIFNLGSNAAHAMRTEGGVIKVTLSTEELTSEQSSRLGGVTSGKYVRLSVSDTGHGMDAATMRRIFEPFFTTKNTREGTGLGLAVVHGIVRAHRGAIAVDSELGVGSTFHIYLPAAKEENAAVASHYSSAPQGTGQFICVVDDEEIVGSCTKLALESKGYQAAHYRSAAECLETMKQGGHGAPDLLLTDQTMPGMQGTELAAQMRKNYPGLPVVIMSGYFSKISSEALNELGHVGLLAKPFTTEELAQAIDRALQPKPAG